MGHRAVAVPEEYAAGADGFQDVTDFGNYGVGGAGDDGVVLDLLFVGAGEDAAGADTAAAGLGGHGLGGEHPAAGGEAGEVEQGLVGSAFVAGEEGVAGPLHVLAAGFLGQFLGLVHVYFPQVADVLGAGGVAQLGGGIVVELEGLSGGFHFRGQHYVGDALFGGPDEGVAADHARQPDGGMGFLVGLDPGVDVAELVVFAFPAEGAGGSPGFDDEFVGFLEAFPVVVGFYVVGDAFAAGTAYPAGHQPAVGDHIDHCQLFHQPEGVVPDGDDVAQEDDFGALGDAGQDGGFYVHSAAHTEGGAVMFVEHQAVEAHFLGVDFFVQVAVVEGGAQFGVVDFVADVEVHNRLAGGAEVAGFGVLVRSFSEVSDEHFAFSFGLRRRAGRHQFGQVGGYGKVGGAGRPVQEERKSCTRRRKASVFSSSGRWPQFSSTASWEPGMDW